MQARVGEINNNYKPEINPLLIGIESSLKMFTLNFGSSDIFKTKYFSLLQIKSGKLLRNKIIFENYFVRPI